MKRYALTACVVAAVCIALQNAAARTACGDEPAASAPTGKWIVLVNETATGRTETPTRHDYRLEITGDQFIWNTNGLIEKVSYQADAKNLGSLDIVNGTVFNRCIYRIEGDTLKLCIGWFNAPRPKTFTIKQERRASLVTLKREQ
jgi:uncharacterized protein (TIGR03067 family)